jgi:ribosomal protein S17E
MIKISNSFYLLLASFCFLLSCKSQDTAIRISPEPVLSEKESFVTSYGNIIYAKYDYYLLEGDLSDKQKVKEFLDSITSINLINRIQGFNDYIVSYYKKSSQLNESVILKEDEKLRYKCFVSKYYYWYDEGKLGKPFITYGAILK